MTPLVSLQNVSKSYPAPTGEGPTPILESLSLDVEKGRAIAVVGPSGSGKSTLLNLIGGLASADSGTVKVDGQDVSQLDPDALAAMRLKKIGFVFQAHHLLPQCTALENVLIPSLADRANSNAKELEDRARGLLDHVGLSHRLNHRPAALSGGEAQRVAVVRALIMDPAIVLADEPTGSLDPRSADGLGDLLYNLHHEQGRTLIVVTHSEKLAAQIGDVYKLDQGRLRPYDLSPSPAGNHEKSSAPGTQPRSLENPS